MERPGQRRAGFPQRHLGVVGLLLVLLGGCGPASSLKEPLKVGLVGPFSGHEAATGYQALFAAKQALREWNEGGGIRGHPIELVVEDDGNDPQRSLLQLQKLAQDPALLGVIGPVAAPGPPSRAPGAAVELPRVILSLGFASLKGVQGEGGFLLGPTHEEVAQAAAAFARRRLGAHQVALVAEGTWGESGLWRVLPLALEREGVQAISHLVVSPEDTAYEAMAARAMLGQPQAVLFLGSAVKGGGLARRLKELRGELAFLCVVGCVTPNFVRVGGAAVNGSYYLTPAADPIHLPRAAAFRQDYLARSGMEPWATAAAAYEATSVLLEAIARASARAVPPDRAAVRRELALINGHPGFRGPIAFTSGGTLLKPQLFFYKIEDGRYPGELIR